MIGNRESVLCIHAEFLARCRCKGGDDVPSRCHKMTALKKSTASKVHAMPNRQNVADPIAQTWVCEASFVIRYKDDGKRPRHRTERAHSTVNRHNRNTSLEAAPILTRRRRNDRDQTDSPQIDAYDTEVLEARKARGNRERELDREENVGLPSWLSVFRPCRSRIL